MTAIQHIISFELYESLHVKNVQALEKVENQQS